MSKFICAFILVTSLINLRNEIPDSKLAKAERVKLWPKLKKELLAQRLKPNSNLYLRIFKHENELEIWSKSGKKYSFFKTYNICYFSGGLGTKTNSGDKRSPEGFYTIYPNQLAPVSKYYLAINIGYPNKLERLKGYTGDAVMIHGHCVSIGCYAMTDDGIAEIFTLVYMAFKNGQEKINLDIFPFRMSDEEMEKHIYSPYMNFWETLKPGYDLFNKKLVPTDPDIDNNNYVFKN